MSDQADALRRIVRVRERPSAASPSTRARSLVFTGGKGGVGTSNLALNLAVALAEAGQRVTLVDADFGLANLDLLCGLTPRHDLGDVLAENRPIAEAAADGPAGIRMVVGAHGIRTLGEALEDGPRRLAAAVDELAVDRDYLLIDAGSGLGRAAGPLATSADEVIIVATPEPTAVADAHAAIRHLSRLLGDRPTRLRAAVNQAESAQEADDVLARLAGASREFLGVVVEPLGAVRRDPRVPRAVRRRRPFITTFPASVASRDIRRLARVLLAERSPRALRGGWFPAFIARPRTTVRLE